LLKECRKIVKRLLNHCYTIVERLLTIWRLTATIWVVLHNYPPDAAFYVLIQQLYIMNILKMLHSFRLFLFKMPFIS